MKKDKIFIVLNSPEFNISHLDLELDFDYTVAVDGGIDHIINSRFKVDLHLGDMDSASDQNYLTKDRRLFPVDKDYSDFHLALEAAEKGG